MLPINAREQRGLSTLLMGLSDLELGHVGSALHGLAAAHTALHSSPETFILLVAAAGLASAYQLQGSLHRAAYLHHDVIRDMRDAIYQQVPAVHIYLGLLY